MDTEHRKISPLLETLICTVLFFICAWSGQYIYVTYIALPFIAAYVYAKNGLSWGAAMIVAGAAIFFILNREMFLMATLMFLIPSVLTGWAIRSKMGAFESVVLSAGGFLMSIGVAVLFIHIKMDMRPIDWMMTMYKDAVNSDGMFPNFMYSYLVAQTGMPAPAAATLDMLSFFRSMVESVQTYMNNIYAAMTAPAEQARAYLMEQSSLDIVKNLLTMMSATLSMKLVIFGGITVYWLPRHLVKRSGAEVASVPGFKMIRMPIKSSGWLIFLYLLSQIPIYFGINKLVFPALLLASALEAIFIIQGTTLICWLFSRKSDRKLWIFLSVLIAVMFGMIVPYIGFFDQMLKVRDRVLIMQKKKK